MKIAVLNFSGNTGKTTLSKHLFAPLLSARRVSIEDVNTGDGEPDLQISSTKFKSLAAELNMADDHENFVIDIGASNAKHMLEHFGTLATTRGLIDYWVIPVVSATKQKIDSLNTAKSLVGIGIAPEKIVMVLNNVADVESVEHDFSTVFAARALGIVVVDQVVLSTEVFELLKGNDESVFDIANNRPDFISLKKEVRARGDEQELIALGQRMVVQDLAEFSVKNLRAVFQASPMAIAGTT